MRIHETGDPSRPALVLVHGLASSPRCWERNLPEIGDGHRTILVDLFAHHPRRFSIAAAAEELAARLAALDAWGSVLVGHSMGGLVALQLAATAPQLVSRMVLVDAPALQVPRRRMRQVGAVARSSMRRQASGMGLVLGCVIRTRPRLLLAATRAVLHADFDLQARSASVPTLLVWGEDDHIVPLAVARGLAERMPSAQLTVIAGAGHQPMWERPTSFNAALLAFLGTKAEDAAFAASSVHADPPHRFEPVLGGG